MESQAPDEEVVRLEKVASETALGQRYDVWDVHTSKHRWWVVTNPTNLYSQTELPSMDHALSFHLGLRLRIVERQRKDPPGEEERARLAGAWRRFGQAVDGLNAADEAEEFQAVGMRCRECLLAFVRDVAHEYPVPLTRRHSSWRTSSTGRSTSPEG